MPDPVMKRPAVPQWLDPSQRSVVSPWWQNAVRMLAGLAGVNDPASQVATAISPMAAAIAPEAGTLGRLGAVSTKFTDSPFPVVNDDVAMPIYRAAKGGTKTVQEVPLAQMVGTQSTVQPGIVSRYSSTGSQDLPQVVKSGDTYYIADGHHRLAAAVKNGETTAKVEVLEAEPGAQPPPYQSYLDRMRGVR